MNRSLLPLALIVTAATASAAPPARMSERVEVVTDYDRVVVMGNFIVDLKDGGPSAARIMAPSDAIDRVRINVIGNTLMVRANTLNSWGSAGAGNGPIRIKLVTRRIRGLSNSGASQITATGLRAAALTITNDGSGRIDASGIETDKLAVTAQGSGEVTLAGKALGARIDARGSGRIDAHRLVIEDLHLNVQGSGDISAFATRSTAIDASGTGNIMVGGKTACQVANHGSTTISCGAGAR